MVNSLSYFSFQANERKRMLLFNDALNTFSYGYMASDIIMLKDHSDSERRNPLPPHGQLVANSNKGSFICTIHTDKIAHSRGALARMING